MSALSLSVSAGHLQHELEPLMQLLHAVTVASRLRLDRQNNVSTSSTPTATAINLEHPSNSWPRDWKYTYITRHLLRIFIAKLATSSANEWIVAMIGCVMGYWHQLTNIPQNIALNTGNKDTVSKDGQSENDESNGTGSKSFRVQDTPTVYTPAVYLQEHYFTSIYNERRAVSWQTIEGGWVGGLTPPYYISLHHPFPSYPNHLSPIPFLSYPPHFLPPLTTFNDPLIIFPLQRTTTTTTRRRGTFWGSS